MELPDKLSVIVIGAGSTGLLLAQGLKQNNIKCTVYEREDASSYQTRPREWGMTLHWGATYIAKCIPPELEARLNEICCDPFYGDRDLTLPHYNGKTGEKLFAMPGENPRRISRRKLRNFLTEGIDVEYGKKLQSITRPSSTTITASFADGTTATGTLLIGCDGAKSIAREALLGPPAAKLVDLDINMINISCAYSAETAKLLRTKHPCFKNSYHPTQGTMFWQSIQDVQDPERPETWLFQNILSWMGAPRPEDLPDQAARTAFFKGKGKEYAEPWRSAALQIPEDLKFGIDRTTVFTPDMDWSKSELGALMTLAGDAAHAMPAHRGQGLNNALQDAAGLVEELAKAGRGEKSPGEAVRAYEEDMRRRVLVEIPISIAQARMVHSWETLMSAPMIKMGMNALKQEEAEKGKENAKGE